MEIITLNVRGLNSQSKRQTIYHWLKEKHFNIICLQETYVTETNVPTFNNDWDGASYHSCTNSTHSRGVSILCNKSFDHKLLSSYSDNEGRKLLINIEYCGQVYTIVNVYAPNECNQKKDFFNKSRNWIIERAMNINCMFICGDFNTSLAEIDRKIPNVDRSRPVFLDFITYFDIKDSVRTFNKDKPMYTYSDKAGNIKSRIDYIFCSNYVMNLAKKTYILHPPKVPDHKAVILKLYPDVKCGKGYWKFNVDLLTKDAYTSHIKNVIKETVNEYSNVLNKRQLWDYCKLIIKESTIQWASENAKQDKERINQIEKEINDLEALIDQCNDDVSKTQFIERKETLLIEQETYHNAKAKGAQIRSRAKWVESGERNNKYFLNLEKQHQTNNRISFIKNSKNKSLYKSDDILEEGAKFYSDLFSKSNISDKDIDNFLNGINTNHVLTEIEAQICEGLITEHECLTILNKMAKNKTPGFDGLPLEYYLYFWENIKSLVIDSFNESFEMGELSETQKQMIISLIFKKNERHFFKNYRPISLSNVDYKILAFILSARLQNVLHKLISPEQVAYVKERFIGQNIRLLLDIIEYARKFNKNGVILFLDFEKAFDSLSWDFIFKCLKKMGFKENFCQWVKIIYTKPKAFIKINGFLSRSVNIERGIRQGCPLSALIFIICTEFLSLYIKEKNDFEGFIIESNNERHEMKITQR